MQLPVPTARLSILALLAALLWLPMDAAAQKAEEPKQRRFAPGVLTTIAPEILPEETSSTHEVVEFRATRDLSWRPEYLPTTGTLYERAAKARFSRKVWCLEFTFKPMRMIWVDVPQPSGKMERKLVWYMVYSVKNTGKGLAPVKGDDGLPKAEPTDIGPVRFLPHFVLQGHDQVSGRTLYRAYLNRYIPAAVESIRRRETPGRKLLTSVQMSQNPIPPSTEGADNEVWGVAMWQDVDPKIDYFSVFVRGLTNAYRWEDPAGAYEPGDPPGTGRLFVSKTLQLNFFRPGDQFAQHESEIRYGVAPGKADLYGEGVTPGLAHRWVYR